MINAVDVDVKKLNINEEAEYSELIRRIRVFFLYKENPAAGAGMGFTAVIGLICKCGRITRTEKTNTYLHGG